MTKIEKQFYIFLIALSLITLGVQIGIAHGKKLQFEDIKDNYEYTCTN